VVNWAYLAGFIDCDGWVTQSNGRYVIGLTQSRIFLDQMKQISEFLTENRVFHSFIERDTVTMIRGEESTAKMCNIHIKAQEALRIVCEAILPYSLIKKDKIESCLAYAKERLAKRGVGIELPAKQLEKRKWNRLELEILADMRIKGYGHRYIAHKLGRSVNSVSRKFHKLNGGK